MTKTTTMSREKKFREQNKFWKFLHGEGFWWDEDNNTLGEDEWTTVWKWITSFTKRKVNKALTSRDNEWRERIRGMKKTDRYVEVFDNDSHRYQIPFSKIDEWKQFVEIPEDDERSWDVPIWAERIDGQPVTDHQSYNKALDDLLEQMEDKK